MITRRHALFATAGLLALSGRAHAADAVEMPKAGKRDWAAQVPTLRIGLLGGENDSDRLGRYKGYQALLETTFEMPVRLYPAADYAGVIQAFGAKQIEIASMGASGYAGAWIDTE